MCKGVDGVEIAPGVVMDPRPMNMLKLAAPGSVIAVEPSDWWECPCGVKESPGMWASAHWDFELIHTCDCGIVRTLCGGKLSTPSGG